MATITDIIKTIIPTSRPRLVVGVLAGAMVVCAGLNIFFSTTPLAHLNDRIVERFDAALKLPLKDRLPVLSQLREDQEKTLMGRPVEPFAWSRLSYLRKSTQGNAAEAFAALRMSNLVSPYEPRQLLERALMWREMREVQSDDQKDYQTTLWQKAFRRQPSETVAAAEAKNLMPEVNEALRVGDPDQYEIWKSKTAAPSSTPSSGPGPKTP